MGTEGCGAVGRRQGLGGDCPPLQFLMIFLFKGLQGERGLRGLTGEKGEPVRGGGRAVATDEEPWGDGLGPLGWLSSGRWEVKLSAPQPCIPQHWDLHKPSGSKEAHLQVPSLLLGANTPVPGGFLPPSSCRVEPAPSTPRLWTSSSAAPGFPPSALPPRVQASSGGLH